MYHYRRCSPVAWDAWAQVPDIVTGELRPASAQDLLNLGAVVVHRDADQVIYSSGRVDGPWDDLPGEPISPTSGPRAYLQQRHQALPADAKPLVHRARVYRAPPGHSLAGSAAEAIRAHREAREARGMSSRIEVRHVAEAEVQPGDAVEVTGLIPHRWAGEPDR